MPTGVIVIKQKTIIINEFIKVLEIEAKTNFYCITYTLNPTTKLTINNKILT